MCTMSKRQADARPYRQARQMADLGTSLISTREAIEYAHRPPYTLGVGEYEAAPPRLARALQAQKDDDQKTRG
jgi:hypothetical protein